MSLINKLKNILFEEEEVEIPVLEKKGELKKQEMRKSPAISSFYDDLEPVKKEEPQEDFDLNKKSEIIDDIDQDVDHIDKVDNFTNLSNHEEKTFNFPLFDEEEFEKVAPKPRDTNVLEYERKKNEKKVEAPKPKKVEEKKETNKFRPSPIISPVYGILDKNYTPDDITSRQHDLGETRALNVDEVRKKAFGSFEDKRYQEEKPAEPEEEITFDDQIFEEKLEKARTIDELLKDSSDDYIDIAENVEDNSFTDYAPEDFNTEDSLDTSDFDTNVDSLEDFDNSFTNKTLNISDAFEDNTDNDEDFSDNLEEKRRLNRELEDIEPVHKESLEDDTLESDLFDLIDSMYENREDGE